MQIMFLLFPSPNTQYPLNQIKRIRCTESAAISRRPTRTGVTCARLGSVRLGSARLSSALLGSARLYSTLLCAVELYCILLY